MPAETHSGEDVPVYAGGAGSAVAPAVSAPNFTNDLRFMTVSFSPTE